MTRPEAGVALPLDAIVGRDQELLLVARLLDETRFVTLTGLGGAGKTRLAHEVARRWTASPVVFVDLSAVGDPRLFASAVAEALGSDAPAQVDPEQAVSQRIASSSLLLVLDNLEQIQVAGAVVRRWLMAAPDVRALVTSRLPLSVGGERVVVLQPLPFGTADDAPSPAAELFVREATRAGALDREPVDYARIERIVERLGGIPLAIEIAAARTRVLSLRQIERRLAPADGSSPERRILDDVLDWTVSLQPPPVRDAFTRLGAFAGPFNIELLDDLWPGMDAPQVLDQLVAASLVRRAADGERWELLVPIREYAAARLAAAGEVAATMARLAAFVTRYAVDLDAPLTGPSGSQRYATLAAHHAVVRGVVGWAVDADPVLAADIVGRLGVYWWRVGAAREARDLVAALVGRDLPDPVRASLLTTSAIADLDILGPAASRPTAEAAVALALRSHDDGVALEAILALARTLGQQADHDAALGLLDQAVAIARRRGDASHEVSVLGNRAVELIQSGRLDEGRRALEEVYATAERHGMTFYMAMALANRATIDISEGRGSDAIAKIKMARELAASFGPGSFETWLVAMHAHAALVAGQVALARTLVLQAAPGVAATGSWEDGALVLDIAAGVLHRRGRDRDAARLLGTATALRIAAGRPEPPREDHDVQELRLDVRARCGAKVFDRLTAVGAADDPSEVLRTLPALLASDGAEHHDPTGLTSREREVARLIQAGASDAEIAHRLDISPKTASVHVANIKRKIGVETRTELALALAAGES